MPSRIAIPNELRLLRIGRSRLPAAIAPQRSILLRSKSWPKKCQGKRLIFTGSGADPTELAGISTWWTGLKLGSVYLADLLTLGPVVQDLAGGFSVQPACQSVTTTTRAADRASDGSCRKLGNDTENRKAQWRSEGRGRGRSTRSGAGPSTPSRGGTKEGTTHKPRWDSRPPRTRPDRVPIK
jgi:hypothetical protein